MTITSRYAVMKYGTFQYGADVREALAWGVLIDWVGAGTYINEAPRMSGININRGRKRLLKPNGQGFESIPTGTAIIQLKNYDGRFDAWNDNSPLYPYVGYGKNIILKNRDLSSTDSAVTIFTGTITDIRTSGYGQDAIVTIYCADALEYFRNNVARVALDENISVSDAIEAVLDSVNWTGARDIDSVVDTIRYWWASGNKLAMSELEDLSVSFLGYFFATKENAARFIQRTAVSDIVQTYDQREILKDISNPQPYEIQRNITRLKVHPRTESTTTTIWQTIGDPVSILAGQTRIFFADYTYLGMKVPARNVAVDTFQANTQSDFTGTNLTTDCVLTLTDFGDTAKISVTNNSASLAYINVVLEGNAIYEESNADVTYPEDVSTITNPRELFFDLIWQQNPNVANDLSLVLGEFYESLHPTPMIKIVNRPSLQYPLELFDIVLVNIPKLGLTGETLRIGGIEHRSLNENCQAMETRLYLEPYVSGGDFMQWDTASDFDDTTIFGY